MGYITVLQWATKGKYIRSCINNDFLQILTIKEMK
jgi:hypothetical protein